MTEKKGLRCFERVSDGKKNTVTEICEEKVCVVSWNL